MKNITFFRALLIAGGVMFGTALPALASHETWTPYTGVSEVTREYSFQRMLWNNISGFGSNSTYEHETVIDNATFADEGSYWASNLPLSYKDTRVSDKPWYDNFTIGSSSAINIVRGAWYYTYYDLRPSIFPTTSSWLLINGQLGHRTPSWCYQNTWCVYGDLTYGLARLNAPHWGLPWTR